MDSEPMAFGFELLQETSFTECRDYTFFISLIQRLKKLCSLKWNEINLSSRHSFGYEKIPISQIRKKVFLSQDVNCLLIFRATGDNHVFLGFREGNTFEIVFIEAEFGDIYAH